jgi:drug/metabolite transporter (DMT)-like permease
MTERATRGGFGVTDLMLLAMATIWAINFSVVKYATTMITPMAFTGLRVGICAVVLVALILLQRKPLPSGRDIMVLLVLGIIGNGVYQLLFVEGVSRTRAGNAALIVAAAPGFIAVVSRMRGIERASRRVLSGIALSIVGVGFVVLGSSGSSAKENTFLGSLLVFSAVLCWTAYTVGLQPLTKRVDHVQLAGIAMVGGVIPLLFTTIPAIAATSWGEVSVGGWASVLYASVLSMVVGYLFWYRGLKVLGPTRTASYSNLQPVIALAVAWIFLHEVPTAWQVIGVVTIMSGVLLTRS